MSPRLRGYVRHAPAAAALAALAAGWSLLSWRRWPDLLIDYGRELYVPWRLSEGAVLYRDLDYQFGPLSAYVNAGLMRVFGVGFDTLFLANLALTAVFTGLVYGLALRWLSRLQAGAVAAAFLCLMAFSHLQAVGNYNFVCPYAQPLTHGLMLAVLAALASMAFARSGRSAWLVLAHALLGATLLCKPEPALAAAAAVAAGWGCAWRLGRLPGRRAAGLAAAAAVTTLLPAVLLAVVLWPDQPMTDRLGWLASPFMLIGRLPPAGRHFYERLSGMHDPLRSVLHVGLITAVECLAVAGLYALVRLTSRRGTGWQVLALLMYAGVCLGAAVAVPRNLWLYLPRSLPVLLGVLAVALVRRLGAADAGRASAAAELLILTVLALGLLPKILLRVQLDHYGFALAAPAALLTVGMAVGPAAQALVRRTGNGFVGHAVVWMSLLTITGWHVKTSVTHYRAKDTPCGRGRDLLWVDGQAPDGRNGVLMDTLAYAETVVPSEARLAALPDWVMLNYLTRRLNPSPYHRATPLDLELLGEARLIDALQADPPELVVICGRSTHEMGAGYFDVDYGGELGAWITAHYVERLLLGTWPPRPDAFGARVLQHRAHAAGETASGFLTIRDFSGLAGRNEGP